ncbi:hypothetical protein Tco_0636362 [Tanacetum coccineum]
MSSIENIKDDDMKHTDTPMIKKPKFKIGDEFMKILHDNAYNGMDVGDVIDHIAKILEISEWIKIPNVDKNELRLNAFSNSLSKDAKNGGTMRLKEQLLLGMNWAINFSINTTHCPMLAIELDRNTKSGLWEFYVNKRLKGTIGDLNENDKKTCFDSFFKPYLDAQEGKEIYNFLESNRDFSPIPVPARRDINNPDEMCKSEEFMVVR